MLGTNDFQSMHNYNIWHSAQGIATLASAIRQAPIEPDMPVPQILVVAPPPIRTPRGPIAPKFEGGEVKCIGLAAAYNQVCAEIGCDFLDAGMVTISSNVDGVHLDINQHAKLGLAIAKAAEAILSKNMH